MMGNHNLHHALRRHGIASMPDSLQPGRRMLVFVASKEPIGRYDAAEAWALVRELEQHRDTIE